MPTIQSLAKKQLAGLWLDQHKGIRTTAQAAKFLRAVGVALRYGATPGLPMASMYSAVWQRKPSAEEESEAQRRAIELTNGLLESGVAVEVNILADRLALVDKKLIPPLYVLRRRGRALEDLGGLSMAAARAYALISQKKTATAGGVRELLGVRQGQIPDPAVIALAELQRHLLVDRGASDVPEEGIPYLSKEGYPYRVFHQAHPDLMKAAAKLALEDAAHKLLLAYLKAAVFALPKKLAWLFKLCLTENEVRMALVGLAQKKKLKLTRVGNTEIVLAK